MEIQKPKKVLQILSATLLFLSICPYLYLFFSIDPVYFFQQQTGGNALLQIYIPVCLIGLLGFLAFLLLIISLFIKDKGTEREFINSK
jgi:polyferredoxin